MSYPSDGSLNIMRFCSRPLWVNAAWCTRTLLARVAPRSSRSSEVAVLDSPAALLRTWRLLPRPAVGSSVCRSRNHRTSCSSSPNCLAYLLSECTTSRMLEPDRLVEWRLSLSRLDFHRSRCVLHHGGFDVSSALARRIEDWWRSDWGSGSNDTSINHSAVIQMVISTHLLLVLCHKTRPSFK